jgi:hypothetical protein
MQKNHTSYNPSHELNLNPISIQKGYNISV